MKDDLHTSWNITMVLGGFPIGTPETTHEHSQLNDETLLTVLKAGMATGRLQTFNIRAYYTSDEVKPKLFKMPMTRSTSHSPGVIVEGCNCLICEAGRLKRDGS